MLLTWLWTHAVSIYLVSSSSRGLRRRRASQSWGGKNPNLHLGSGVLYLKHVGAVGFLAHSTCCRNNWRTRTNNKYSSFYTKLDCSIWMWIQRSIHSLDKDNGRKRLHFGLAIFRKAQNEWAIWRCPNGTFTQPIKSSHVMRAWKGTSER